MTAIYLDNNATTKPLTAIGQLITTAPFGNPSSQHLLGFHSRKAIDDTRRVIAECINTDELDTHVVFTSGGTEANNWICHYAAQNNLTVYTTAIEHSSIEMPLKAHNVNVELIPLDHFGCVNLSFIDKITDGLVFIHHVNSETGVIQPLEAIGQRLKQNEKNVLFAIDAAQSFGRCPIDVEAMNIDMLTASGHKFHALKGTGFLWSTQKIPPQLFGGGQQEGLRSGTENVLGILSMKVAIEDRIAHFERHIQHMQTLRDNFEKRLCTLVPSAQINCQDAKRVCNTSSICFDGIENDRLFGYLDRQDVYVSKGSACLSNTGASSKIMTELFGVDIANSTLRFSFSKDNTKEEIDRVLNILNEFDW